MRQFLENETANKQVNIFKKNQNSAHFDLLIRGSSMKGFNP